MPLTLLRVGQRPLKPRFLLQAFTGLNDGSAVQTLDKLGVRVLGNQSSAGMAASGGVVHKKVSILGE